jgi:hypothetical protein
MLKNRVTFYVPSTQNVGQPLPTRERKALVSRVERVFAQEFGGATRTEGVGSYVANDGSLIQERVTLVTSYHALETSEALAIVIPLAQAIKAEYGQEAIAIETEQGIDFI